MGDEVKGGGAMVPQSNQLTIANSAAVMQQWGFGPGKTNYITCVDESTQEGKRKVFALLQANGEKFDEYFNTEILATDFLISPIELENEQTGEMRKMPLTRILLADGKTILQTTGRVVAEVLLAYATRIRNAPWSPPAKFKPRKQTTRSGGQFYTLEPLFD